MIDSTVATRSVLLALLLGFGSATACIDETVLENDECLSPDDCFNNQECVITLYQSQELLGFGWCRPEGDGCVAGDQPGCYCAEQAGSRCCTGTAINAAEQTVSLVPFVDGSGICTCVLDGDPNYPSSAAENERCVTAG